MSNTFSGTEIQNFTGLVVADPFIVSFRLVVLVVLLDFVLFMFLFYVIYFYGPEEGLVVPKIWHFQLFLSFSFFSSLYIHVFNLLAKYLCIGSDTLKVPNVVDYI